MRHGRMVFILGNVNAQFDMLNYFIDEIVRKDELLASMRRRYEEDGDDFQAMILQSGDIAYFWPGDEIPIIHNQIDWLPGGRIPFYWIGGNHDDWDELDKLGSEISEVGPGVFYCPFGTTMTLSPDVTILFAGGTESTWKDTMGRLVYMQNPDSSKIWWEQEGISDADMERLTLVPNADWVISHTAPYAFDVPGRDAESREKLDAVLTKYRPKRWFFGHFARFAEGETDGCHWESLSGVLEGGKFWDKELCASSSAISYSANHGILEGAASGQPRMGLKVARRSATRVYQYLCKSSWWLMEIWRQPLLVVYG